MLRVRSTAPAPRVFTSSTAWCAYFQINASQSRDIPWDSETRLSEPERRAVAASIQEFQLGESSEGRHLQAAARAYAAHTGDLAYVRAIHAFIREEQRHARELGRFLTAEGIALRTRSWSDVVFRWLRRGASLEPSIAVLLTAEIIAQVYYDALRDATESPVLRALCDRILLEEAAHVRFQAERLAMLRAGRSQRYVQFALAGQRILFAAAVLVVWQGHRAAVVRGGYSFGRLWARCWQCFDAAAEMMTPVSPDGAPDPSAPAAQAGADGLEAIITSWFAPDVPRRR